MAVSLQANNDTQTTAVYYERSGLISSQVSSMIIFALNNVIGIPLTTAGIIGNIFNIIVFTRQGFKDTINISFTSLSVSDLAFLVHTLWQSLSVVPALRNMRWPINFGEISVVTGSIPRLYFSRVSSVITVYIAMERCIAVRKPLQVKLMFTRRRLIVTMLGCYILNAVPFSLSFFTTRVGWQFDFMTNRTYLGVIFERENQHLDRIGMSIGVFILFSTFIIISACAVILVWTLYSQSMWRSKMAQTPDQDNTDRAKDRAQKKSAKKSIEDKTESYETGLRNDPGETGSSRMSERDKRAAKTVTLLAVMFVFCYLRRVLFQIVMLVEPEFSRGGRYRNAYLVLGVLGLRLEGVCASANIVVYYKTSTKFRESVMAMVCTSTKAAPG